MKNNLEEIREKEKKYADRGKKKAIDFEVGDKVLYRQNHGEWLPAKVVADTGTPRPVIIETPDGNSYRQNFWFLRKDTSNEDNSNSRLNPEKVPSTPEVKNTDVPNVNTELLQKNFTVSWFGRKIVPPERLDL